MDIIIDEGFVGDLEFYVALSTSYGKTSFTTVLIQNMPGEQFIAILYID